MGQRVNLTITFTGDDGTPRSQTEELVTSYTPDLAGVHRVANILLAELKVTVGEHAPPKHYVIAQGWLEFPNDPTTFDQYFDIQNSQAMWFELANLVMGAEGDLVLAEVYKALEPPLCDNADALNDLFYVHDCKMRLLNQSVHALIKVQELVNRLLHESLGGDLVDTADAEWDKDLKRTTVEQGLDAKLQRGAISQSNFDAITQALAIPKNTPKGQTVQTYRNRLAHHIRPSVDYAIFFSALSSRTGAELKDAKGKVIGKRHTVYDPPVQYSFRDLHTAFSEYLDAIVTMLQQLSRVTILHR